MMFPSSTPVRVSSGRQLRLQARKSNHAWSFKVSTGFLGQWFLDALISAGRLFKPHVILMQPPAVPEDTFPLASPKDSPPGQADSTHPDS